MKNQGISLISLIITIIVIIILAAIVIFSGMDTPERAQLANFGQQVSNISSAITDQLTGVSVNYGTSGRTRNTEQIYYTLATGKDPGQYGYMNGATVAVATKAASKGCQNIVVGFAKEKTNKTVPSGDEIAGLGLALPTVREHDEAWYVTADGKVFNATGFVSGGKTYWTADLYTEGELGVDAADGAYEERAVKIAEALNAGKTGAIAVPESNSTAVAPVAP